MMGDNRYYTGDRRVWGFVPDMPTFHIAELLDFLSRATYPDSGGRAGGHKDGRMDRRAGRKGDGRTDRRVDRRKGRRSFQYSSESLQLFLHVHPTAGTPVSRQSPPTYIQGPAKHVV